MNAAVYYVETLYHLKREKNGFAQIILSRFQERAYEVKTVFAHTLSFRDSHVVDVYVLFDLHEAMNYARDCYTMLLEEGYCYFGVIPAKQTEREKSAEKNRLFRLVEKHCHPEALQALEAWRMEQAKREDVHPHYIFSNRIVLALATFLPQNDEEYMNCPGVGKTKRLYARDVLHICSRYERRFNFPLSAVLPKYKYKNSEEDLFLPFRGKRLPVADPETVRERALIIGERGCGVEELVQLSRSEDRETRKRVASALNKLKLPEATLSAKHLLFDEGPQVRQYMLRAILSSHLEKEMEEDVRRLLVIEPKTYNRKLCKQILDRLE